MPYFRAFDGDSVFYDEIGEHSLPPLIVLSGGPARHPSYLGTLDALADRRRLLVIHQRGVGESAGLDGRTFVESADDVEALRTHLGLEQVDVLAHSAGCRIAIVHAAHHPGAVSRLALVAPAAKWISLAADDSETLVARHASDPWHASYTAAIRSYAVATSWEQRNALFPMIAPIGWAEWNDTARQHERLGAWYPEAQRHFYGPVDPVHIRAGLTDFSGQALLIAGEEDGLSGLSPVLGLAELIPNTTVDAIEACGHYPWVERPAEFAAAVRLFFPEPA